MGAVPSPSRVSKATVKATSPRTASPSGSKPATRKFHREALNKLDDKFDKLDDRLRAVENKISTAKGWITAGFVILVLLQVLLRMFDIQISFK